MDDKQVKEYIASTYLGVDKVIAIKEYDKLAGLDRIFNIDARAMEATGISTRACNILHKTFDYYQNGIGQQEIAGTAYGAYNAITGYYSNIDNTFGQDRMKKMLYGSAATVMANALAFATDFK